MLNSSGFEGALSCHVQGAPCLTLAVSKVLFRHPVSGLRTQRFLGFLSLDLQRGPFQL